MKMLNERDLEGILNKLCKWRTLLAGWQLGTRPKDDPEAQAVRDQRELLLILRCEVTALSELLMKSKVFSKADWVDAVACEALSLDKYMEQRFPGVRTSLEGVHIDAAVASPWMKGWKP